MAYIAPPELCSYNMNTVNDVYIMKSYFPIKRESLVAVHTLHNDIVHSCDAATNTLPKGNFSALRKIKTWLWTSTTREDYNQYLCYNHSLAQSQYRKWACLVSTPASAAARSQLRMRAPYLPEMVPSQTLHRLKNLLEHCAMFMQVC